MSMCKGDCYCGERTLNVRARKVQGRQAQEQEAACARGCRQQPLLLPVSAMPLQADTDLLLKVPPQPLLLSLEWDQHREQGAAHQHRARIPLLCPEGAFSMAKGRV